MHFSEQSRRRSEFTHPRLRDRSGLADCLGGSAGFAKGTNKQQ
jgi:hypothetical protein